MDRRRRTEADWQSLTSEVQALKRKLTSKSEALLIISKDLDSTQKERDQFKLMAEKLRVRCQAYKRQFSDYPLTRDQASLIQMLRDTKNQKVAQQKQCEVLQQKLNEALGDVKLLRERFARQRIGDEGIGPRHFPAHEREELVVQLETTKQQAEQYRQELNISSDQVTELTSERDEFRVKAERLNNELNFMLNGDKKRIIDIDALCMENKYLQERVKQCQEEKNSLHSQMAKLKAVLNARKATNTDIKPGKIRNSGLVISPKQVKEILMNRAGLPTSAESVSDLQSIAAALLETINDKNLALHHLRNTNKILGNRVAELERKLRTLEVAGLWSTNDQTPGPASSTPKIKVEHSSSNNSNLRPMADNEDEFLSSLGSRLSKLTDVCARSFEEYKLVSLTPESSGSVSDAARSGDATPMSNGAIEFDSATKSAGGVADLEDNVMKSEHGPMNINGDATKIITDATNVNGDATKEIGRDAIKTSLSSTDSDDDCNNNSDNVMDELPNGDARLLETDATEKNGSATLWTSCASELDSNASGLTTNTKALDSNDPNLNLKRGTDNEIDATLEEGEPYTNSEGEFLTQKMNEKREIKNGDKMTDIGSRSQDVTTLVQNDDLASLKDKDSDYNIGQNDTLSQTKSTDDGAISQGDATNAGSATNSESIAADVKGNATVNTTATN